MNRFKNLMLILSVAVQSKILNQWIKLFKISLRNQNRWMIVLLKKLIPTYIDLIAKIILIKQILAASHLK